MGVGSAAADEAARITAAAAAAAALVELFALAFARYHPPALSPKLDLDRVVSDLGVSSHPPSVDRDRSDESARERGVSILNVCGDGG